MPGNGDIDVGLPGRLLQHFHDVECLFFIAQQGIDFDAALEVGGGGGVFPLTLIQGPDGGQVIGNALVVAGLAIIIERFTEVFEPLSYRPVVDMRLPRE